MTHLTRNPQFGTGTPGQLPPDSPPLESVAKWGRAHQMIGVHARRAVQCPRCKSLYWTRSGSRSRSKREGETKNEESNSVAVLVGRSSVVRPKYNCVHQRQQW